MNSTFCSRRAALVAVALLAMSPATGRATAARAKLAASKATHAMVLPFIEDDYHRAVAEARARKVPIFVEAWAPW